jgi:hypothetical protein
MLTDSDCVVGQPETSGRLRQNRPFVETIPTSGTLGAKVIILGNNLTGTTTVSFNGTLAKFEVVSDTEITTKVPEGTTTGPVTVTTPRGTLTSNVPFIVHLSRSTGAIRR